MTTLLLLVLAAAGSPAGSAPVQEVPAADTLRGVVVEGRDSVPVPGRTVVLHRVTPDTGMAVDSVRTGPDGRFALPIEAGDGDVLLASTRHEGVLYFGPALHGGTLPSDYRIAVFPTRPAGADPPLSVTRRTIVADPSAGGFEFMDAIEVAGVGDATLVAPPDEAGGPWWEVALPRGVGDVRALPGGVEGPELEVGATSVRVSAPVPAAGQRLVLGYTASGSEPVVFVPERPVERFELVVRGDTATVRVTGLGEGSQLRMERESVLRYGARSLGPGDTVRLVRRAAAGSPGGSRTAAWIAAAVGVLLAVGAGVTWRWS